MVNSEPVELRIIICLLLLICLSGSAVAQDEPTTRDEAWPEVDLYDSRFDTFNRNRFVFGTTFPVTKHFALDLSYARQNDSRSQRNHVNAIGVVLVFTLRNK
jgi:predicted TIM-barrel fold metal-dependent hydrolase